MVACYSFSKVSSIARGVEGDIILYGIKEKRVQIYQWNIQIQIEQQYDYKV
ncbi:hypothetical protein SAMN05421823_104133 [Catalinimonas alkaloidigena]|uniref:Uncharacterized protein n=1 Tax=Catalinimonas alkaloidigena TaxID=1075417 RepID=A0A1G9GKX2_9BACT|nr:hypothetical protein SAMN05421823_104133 [Catalinimonas alkaloidigena]